MVISERSFTEFTLRLFTEPALSGKQRCFAEFILSAVEGLSMTESERFRMTNLKMSF